MAKYDPVKAALEIREQLASDKRKLGFFFGAGTSMAVGLPGIDKLTDDVCKSLEEPFSTQVNSIKSELYNNPNIEDLLNRIRLYKELIGKSDNLEFCGIKGHEDAKNLDIAVCQKISEIISEKPNNSDSHLILTNFIRSLHANREHPIEIFTTNYDLIFEQAFESARLPYFDGFVGSVSPFFVQESVEAQFNKERGLQYYPPRSWTRLWKVHGSINWEVEEKSNRIIRCLANSDTDKLKELVIFPSREKYSQSRKQPFITLQDHLRGFLISGEVLFVIHGYSYSDEHLNEILFQSLRSNQHLSIITFVYENLPDQYQQYGKDFRNLSFYSPDKLCRGGIVYEWDKPSRKKKDGDIWPFWDEKIKAFTLGEFNQFATCLENFIGFRTLSISPSKEFDTQEPIEHQEESQDER
jgi:hypothetical protein